jgi:hypothetical protein
MSTDRFEDVRGHLTDTLKHLAGVAPARELVRRIRVVSDSLHPTPRIPDDVRAIHIGDPVLARDELVLIIGELQTLKGQQQHTAIQVHSPNEPATPSKSPIPGVDDAIGKADKALTILNAWCEC